MEGMGFGDIKMMAMVGAFLGWQFAWLTILIGSFVGAFVGGAFIFLSKRGRMYELPFGTFLGFGAMIVTLVGYSMMRWYLEGVLSS
jgi:leader peptidase (prepilin peptidase)/N-methyltransferase